MVRPNPEIRGRVRELAESRWHEPLVVVHLHEVRPNFEVPGRRRDGTVRGKRLIRRFFHNIFRGVFTAVMNVIMLANGGAAGNVLSRDGMVRGPADAQALDLVDTARPAKNAWLVYSDTRVAIIDSGPVTAEETAKILWHAEKPHAPKVYRTQRRIVWPDGSEYGYHITGDEAAFLKQERRLKMREGPF